MERDNLRAYQLLDEGKSPEDIGIQLLGDGVPYEDVATTLTEIVGYPTSITNLEGNIVITFPTLTQELENEDI